MLFAAKIQCELHNIQVLGNPDLSTVNCCLYIKLYFAARAEHCNNRNNNNERNENNNINK